MWTLTDYNLFWIQSVSIFAYFSVMLHLKNLQLLLTWLNHFHRAWYSNIRFFIWGKPLYIMHADKKEAFKKMEFLFINMYEFGIVRCYFIIYMYVYQYAIK